MARAMSEEFKKIPERDIVVNSVSCSSLHFSLSLSMHEILMINECRWQADPGYVSTNMTSYKGPLPIDEGQWYDLL